MFVEAPRPPYPRSVFHSGWRTEPINKQTFWSFLSAVVKDKVRQGNINEGHSCLPQVLRDDLRTQTWGSGRKPCSSWSQNIPAERDTKGRGHEVGEGSVCFRTSQELKAGMRMKQAKDLDVKP